ncbi:hypothetical protein BGZ83_003381 [Gryganskiella cystojenkinii]|nr:hypothetical protein BGZ83_003381 [Gryganskiella cystojenkinii]
MKAMFAHSSTSVESSAPNRQFDPYYHHQQQQQQHSQHHHHQQQHHHHHSSSGSSSSSTSPTEQHSSQQNHHGQQQQQRPRSPAHFHYPQQQPRESSPRMHHYSPSQSYSTEHRGYPSHHSQEQHQHDHHRQPYHSQQQPQPQPQQQQRASAYPPSSPHETYPSYGRTNDRVPHPSYQPTYTPSLNVRHTEGYEGRVRNTNRDHNDHLLTSDHPGQGQDQQQHHDQFQRREYYGPSSSSHQAPQQYPPSLQGAGRPPYPEDLNKLHLPPILAPEEPFYRKDIPGRHMRYFSNVTSHDREDRQGYYSSARHIAPSNTSGIFGHGPPLGDALDRFGARQQQQHQRQLEQQQQQRHAQQQQQQQQQRPQQEQQQQQQSRLPSLYTALPDQRPASLSLPPVDHNAMSSRSPIMATSPDQRSVGYKSHHYQQQQATTPPSIKPKPIQPRSIAPAPSSPISPDAQSPAISPHDAKKSSSSSMYVKIEPKDHHLQSYAPSSSSRPSPPSPPIKRKWSREHSPVRISNAARTSISAATSGSHAESIVADPSDESSQELHLLSQRRSQSTSMIVSPLKTKPESKKSTHNTAPKMRMQRYQMTTIRCWHGAIAQKSYGIEKRYLCPPPMVQVSAGVNSKQIRAEQPHVTMSVIHEKTTASSNTNANQNAAENLMEQDCNLDDALRCSFRNLHVTGTGSDSSKRFKLGLQVFLNKTTPMPTAIMDSNPIPIISKPSKKTAKAGNASCFILNGMSVSLLNRINAQTVRTKYMAVDNNAVCAKIGSWSSFTIKMVKPPPSPPVKVVPASMGVFKTPAHSTKFVPIRMKGDSVLPIQGGQQQQQQQQQSIPMARSHSQSGGRPDLAPATPQSSSHHQQYRPQQPQPTLIQPQPQPLDTPYHFSNSEPVLYGAEIVLINDLTGIMTDRLIIRKVENGKVSRSGTGPVSQMQKIVLEHPDRVHPEDGRPYYLSASSIGSPKIEGKIPLQAAMDRSPLLEYRTSSKKASIMDMTDNQDDDEEDQDEDGEYNNHGSMRRNKQDSIAVDDFVCWTIAGIAKFDYTYFGPIPSSVDSDVDPNKVPTVLTCPQYNPTSNTVAMQVKNVFEKLTPEEEENLVKRQDDPYQRKLTLSEFVYKRCEDVRQPMRDEEGPVQLWLAQHGPIRMRRRPLEEVLSQEELAQQNHHQEPESEDESDEEDLEEQQHQQQKEAAARKAAEDQLPKIATKANANHYKHNNAGHQQVNSNNGRHYGGSHLPASMNPAFLKNQKRRKMVSRPMGLEAELPYGCEVRASHDGQGNAKAELDILMVERASGIAYRTGYKVVYSRERERSEWVVEIVG